jgi:uncharacterized repeat protein (TIGR03803 family)
MSRKHFARFIFAALMVGAVVASAVSAQAQTFNVIWNAQGAPGPGNNLLGLVLARDGNFYGGSHGGGANFDGVFYRLTPGGTESTVYSVQATDPQCWYTPSILATNGNLYGSGSNCGDGNLFELTTSGTFTVLYTFPSDGSDGSGATLAFQGSNGKLYGTTCSGGANNGGTLFEITTSGTLTTLYTFGDQSSGIYCPQGILLGKDGNYYGVVQDPNGDGDGGVFKLTPSGTLTVLHTFTGTDGIQPVGLIQGTDGNLYGVTIYGGTNGQGTIYKITTSGTLTILHNVDESADSSDYPSAQLIEGSDGNFYSTMASCDEFGCNPPGNVYEITPTGTYTTLGVFNNSNGSQPYWGVFQDPNGSFYGVADSGGTDGCGTVFTVNNSLGAFAKLSNSLGKEASVVGIFGQGFNSTSVVEFGGVQATKIARTGSTFIDATVPAGALTGVVTVTTGSTTLTSWQTFDVIPTFITFSPTSGPVGTPVTLTGTGLTQTTRVTFNGKPASFTVNSDTQVTATVPTDATTGKIDITTKGGGAISSSVFTVN